MKVLKNAIYVKIISIVFIAMFLLIPAGMINNIISEREGNQKQAITEVSAKWAHEQTISGPFISIPYYRSYLDPSSSDSVPKYSQVREYIHILPNELNINGNLNPEMRYRGIFEIVVYNSKINISGKFTADMFANLEVPLNTIQFDKAQLTVGINDLRGIEKQINLNWNDNKFSFNPGVPSTEVVSNGINAPIAINPNDSTDYNFSFFIDLKGSQLLYFTPVGKVTDININSTWKHPSFNGAFLPDSRSISEDGFSANWNVLHLNRNYPQQWRGSAFSIKESAFGIDLLLPVDNYQKSYRSIRYAILIIGFTFLVFILIEVLNKVFLHPIQYILVGMALIVFYTLLVSISEHIEFNFAFGISAVSTIFLISAYTKAILKSTKLTLLMSGLLMFLYSFTFVIIQLQDLALLIGSIGIFIILGMVMFYSRKIDWYELTSNIANDSKQL